MYVTMADYVSKFSIEASSFYMYKYFHTFGMCLCPKNLKNFAIPALLVSNGNEVEIFINISTPPRKKWERQKCLLLFVKHTWRHDI